MKYLLLLILLPVFAKAQEPIWTKCVYEKEYAYIRDNKGKKMLDLLFSFAMQPTVLPPTACPFLTLNKKKDKDVYGYYKARVCKY